MRLSEQNPRGEPILRRFNENDAPPYAILSHTWNAHGEEVSFQDMVAGTDKGKDGYRNIQFCAADGLPYFWIDTCCIDRTDVLNFSRPSILCRDGTRRQMSAIRTPYLSHIQEVDLAGAISTKSDGLLCKRPEFSRN